MGILKKLWEDMVIKPSKPLEKVSVLQIDEEPRLRIAKTVYPPGGKRFSADGTEWYGLTKDSEDLVE